MKLVDDAGSAYRWLSMWAMGLSSAFLATWALIPDDLKAYITGSLPPQYIALGVAVVLVLGMVGRLVDQTPKDKA